VQRHFEGFVRAFAPVPAQSHSMGGECGQCAGASIGRERDGMERGYGGGSHAPLGTSCAVNRGEVGACGWVGLVGFWGKSMVYITVVVGIRCKSHVLL
jgi:hypothetical protein